MRTEPGTLISVYRICLAAVLAAGIFAAGCAVSPPQPVRHLKVKNVGGNLVVTWQNPVDFKRIDVKVVNTKTREEWRNISGYSKQQGAASATLLNMASGQYEVSVDSATGDAGTMKSAGPESCTVSDTVEGGYVTLADLGRTHKEKLDIVFCIHPMCPSSYRKNRSDPRAQLFRQMTLGVLSEVFQTVLQVPDEIGLTQIEDYREEVTKNKLRHRPQWPLNLDALVIVDIREAVSGIPGQLQMRILDLKLARVFLKEWEELKKGLYNLRPLVIEDYHLVTRFKRKEDLRESLLVYRDAWKNLLDKILAHPRYRYYMQLLQKYKENPKPAAISNRDELQAFMFNKLPDSMRPYKSDEQDAEIAAAEFEKRARAIEKLLLFGREVAGPHAGRPILESKKKRKPKPKPRPKPKPKSKPVKKPGDAGKKRS